VEVDEKSRIEIQAAAGGKTLKQLINDLLDAVDPDKHLEKAKEIFNTDSPTGEQLRKASEELAKVACSPFDDPKLRNTLIDVKKRSEQIIDTVSKDVLVFAGADEQAKVKARLYVEAFRKFIEENKDELTALQIIYSKPYAVRHLTYEAIKQLAEAIRKPPYNLTPELLWMAYEQLEKSKVKGAGPQKLLTNIVSLVRFAIGTVDVLEPFVETVNQRFNDWLAEEEKQGRRFTSEQLEWLNMIKDHIATSLTISTDDFDYEPFYGKGGLVSANKVFGQKLIPVLDELNKVLVK